MSPILRTPDLEEYVWPCGSYYGDVSIRKAPGIPFIPDVFPLPLAKPVEKFTEYEKSGIPALRKCCKCGEKYHLFRTPDWCRMCQHSFKDPCSTCTIVGFSGSREIATVELKVIGEFDQTPEYWRCRLCEDINAFETGYMATNAFLDPKGRRCNICCEPFHEDNWVISPFNVYLGSWNGRVVAESGPWHWTLAWHCDPEVQDPSHCGGGCYKKRSNGRRVKGLPFVQVFANNAPWDMDRREGLGMPYVANTLLALHDEQAVVIGDIPTIPSPVTPISPWGTRKKELPEIKKANTTTSQSNLYPPPLFTPKRPSTAPPPSSLPPLRTPPPQRSLPPTPPRTPAVRKQSPVPPVPPIPTNIFSQIMVPTPPAPVPTSSDTGREMVPRNHSHPITGNHSRPVTPERRRGGSHPDGNNAERHGPRTAHAAIVAHHAEQQHWHAISSVVTHSENRNHIFDPEYSLRQEHQSQVHQPGKASPPLAPEIKVDSSDASSHGDDNSSVTSNSSVDTPASSATPSEHGDYDHHTHTHRRNNSATSAKQTVPAPRYNLFPQASAQRRPILHAPDRLANRKPLEIPYNNYQGHSRSRSEGCAPTVPGPMSGFEYDHHGDEERTGRSVSRDSGRIYLGVPEGMMSDMSEIMGTGNGKKRDHSRRRTVANVLKPKNWFHHDV
ncbi:hypothetical protein B0H66DRAFT_567537 [Apodospora peruviana]|uniref:Uncharacterized protein n=1 Tax=Apodospora peruviana TaxID=516989 RepID=A0AAE0HW35_9PEZI|nr:hypothetical protein B0H66DRAFT_567537 [Apodospora peruviana]